MINILFLKIYYRIVSLFAEILSYILYFVTWWRQSWNLFPHQNGLKDRFAKTTTVLLSKDFLSTAQRIALKDIVCNYQTISVALCNPFNLLLEILSWESVFVDINVEHVLIEILDTRKNCCVIEMLNV